MASEKDLPIKQEAQIKSADMSEEMQQEAIEVAQSAMDQFSIEKDIAQYIKKEFDSRKGATWHCIVGRNFGSFVTHAFNSHLKGAENLTFQCQNCGNFSARPMKRWEWFTFCFVPVIPFSLKPYKELGCHICNFWQDIKYRPDVQAQIGGGGAPPQHQQGYQMGGHEQGTGKPGYGPPPAGVPHQYQ
ncbi:uncharacterized protein N0V89_002166 [Didymosphaeria variabile]|uniref:Dynein light chain 1, cytoplasmic n=1 Tax=Didymosphaeria variabile TaxID=1932322 RepID=A0A9W9CE49_9PLEO|nr:uncharacterized protein N0V89_002166 [Didymosphaeria variabile]KAJ4357590.1 hypothetical protein N0V89_002166 [Didymosphaeria variabile]